MELKLLEITNSKPPRPINISDKSRSDVRLYQGFCQPFAKKDKSNPFFVKRKATPIQSNLFLHGDPHDDTHRKALNKQRVLNSLLQARYFCTACNKDPFAYFKSSSIIYTDIWGKVIYNFLKSAICLQYHKLGSSLRVHLQPWVNQSTTHISTSRVQKNIPKSI
jgi:hypothetical protein